MTVLPLDRLFNRLYTWRYNPIYQSGTLAVLFLLVTIVTGLYQLFFYSIGSPYQSVMELESQWYLGRWIRALHSYAGDALIIAVAFHALRMLVQGKTWGGRMLAWVTGVLLVGIINFSAWTGVILVWDLQGQLVATEGARLIDLFPFFSEPIARSFTSPDGVPASFFFLNLLLHMVFPVGMLFLIWIHTFKLARAKFFPPKKLSFWAVLALTVWSIFWPLGKMPEGDSLMMMSQIEVDIFYGWWLVITRNMPVWASVLVLGLIGLVGFSVPWWWRPALKAMPATATVNEEVCTGCTQCYKDCPYDAISMVPPPEGNPGEEKVAHVDASLCVSCGICAGSCAPMLVGPPERRGKNHLENAKDFFSKAAPKDTDLVVFTCEQGLANAVIEAGLEGIVPYPVHCLGATHTSAYEYLLRSGVRGLYLMACPERDCTYREGARWARERVYNDREAELRDRVDKNRVKMVNFSRADKKEALADMVAFRQELLDYHEAPKPEKVEDILAECDPDPEPEIGFFKKLTTTLDNRRRAGND